MMVVDSWVPATHVRKPDGVPGFRLLPGLTLATASKWGMNQWKEDTCLFLSLCLSKKNIDSSKLRTPVTKFNSNEK